MASGREDRIRERAHSLWVEGGRQDGHHDRDWERATREIDAEGAGREPAGRAKAGKRAGTGPTTEGAQAAAGANVKPAGQGAGNATKRSASKKSAGAAAAKPAGAAAKAGAAKERPAGAAAKTPRAGSKSAS